LTKAHTAQMKLILFEILFRKISRKKFNILIIANISIIITLLAIHKIIESKCAKI